MQILIDTAQKRQALGEIEARHKEILDLEENIKVIYIILPKPLNYVCILIWL